MLFSIMHEQISKLGKPYMKNAYYNETTFNYTSPVSIHVWGHIHSENMLVTQIIKGFDFLVWVEVVRPVGT